MRPGSSAAALIQLGESAWCDEMHVLHSFIRPSVHWDLHSLQLWYTIALVDLACFDEELL